MWTWIILGIIVAVAVGFELAALTGMIDEEQEGD